MVPAPISSAQGSAPYQRQSSASGTSTAAEMIRVRKSRHGPLPWGPPPWGFAMGSVGAGAKASLPPGIFRQGRGEMRRAEIRPQHIQEHQLGISSLPEQAIRQPLLPTGTDDQVGVGNVPG